MGWFSDPPDRMEEGFEMNDFATERLRPLAPGLLLAVLTLCFGFGMGGAFGAAEDDMKAGLAASGAAALVQVYQGDEAKMNAVVKKSWVYYKRAHLHANGLGTTALACGLLLAMLGVPGRTERAAGAALGAGALLYSVFWLLAGSAAPGLGSTGAAKESLSFVAIPGSGLCMLGLLGTLYATVMRLVLGRE
jgi:hypothetical protein